MSIDNLKTHDLLSPPFPEQKDTNDCGFFVLMNIYQILKYGTIKELFSANDVESLLHAHFEKHERMMNNLINNTDLVYTTNKDQRAKVRKELENEDYDDNNTNDKNNDKGDDTLDTDSEKRKNIEDDEK